MVIDDDDDGDVGHAGSKIISIYESMAVLTYFLKLYLLAGETTNNSREKVSTLREQRMGCSDSFYEI